VPDHPRLPIEIADARRYLAGHERRWDVIAADTFFDDGVPFHLTTREYLELLRSRLTPGGVVVTNLIGSAKGSSSKLFRAVYRTYRSVFPTVLVHPLGDAESYGNVIIVAMDGAAPSKHVLRDTWGRLRARHPSAPPLGSAISRRYDATIPTADVPTLTDAYAPVDALLTAH
jgi:spermidine synthase